MSKRTPVLDRVVRMQGYVPGEQPKTARLIKLNTNENPYPPSPGVARAVAHEAEGKNLSLYPSPMADGLREKAAQVYGVGADQVLVGNGSDDVLAVCLRACAGEGGIVAYTVPTYFIYRTLVDVEGARRVEFPFTPTDDGAEGSAQATVRLPDDFVNEPARVKFVCTPNSPLGYAVSLQEIARLAEASDALVVADEAYADFGDTSALALLDDHPNLLVSRSFSKSFSLAGARLGLGFGSAELIEQLVKVKDSYNVSRFSAAAGEAALADIGWMKANVAKVRATRERVSKALRDGGRRVRGSHANFLWVECEESGGLVVYDKLRSAGILVRWFDEPGLRDGIRVSIGTDADMDAFLDVIL